MWDRGGSKSMLTTRLVTCPVTYFGHEYLVTSCVYVWLRVVFVFDYKLCLCLLTNSGKDRLRPVLVLKFPRL
jgi:hypothetical protein